MASSCLLELNAKKCLFICRYVLNLLIFYRLFNLYGFFAMLMIHFAFLVVDLNLSDCLIKS